MKLSGLLFKPIKMRPPALAAPKQLQSAIERVHRRWPNIVVEPRERDRERLVREMRRRLETNDWSGVTISDVTSAAVALFDEERRARVDLATLRQFYCAEIACSDSASFINSMFEIYVESYVPGAPHTVGLAGALSHSRNKIGGRWETFFTSFPECLDPHCAHKTLAERMTQMASPWSELQDLGLRSPHAPGLMDHAHLLFVGLTAPSLNDRPPIDRFLKWLQPEGKGARLSGAAEAITALLTPWQHHNPREDDKHHLISRLTTMYGDPRVRGENAIWSGVAANLRAIMERWLTGENIRFFLDVVSAVDKSNMWEPRRKFWLDLHEQRRIDAAWVAFSNAAAAYAKNHETGNAFLRFGHQVAGGTRKNTSLLILKIGNKIVVEGSHDYKVHVFRSDNSKAPKLYEQSYDCEAIRHIAGAWTRAHNGDWQGRVLEKI